MMTIDVRTNAYPSGLIVSELIEDAGTAAQHIMRSALNTQEQQIREALIKLGWTPPPGCAQPSTNTVESKL